MDAINTPRQKDTLPFSRSTGWRCPKASVHPAGRWHTNWIGLPVRGLSEKSASGALID
jgi:hypothetical protein